MGLSFSLATLVFALASASASTAAAQWRPIDSETLVDEHRIDGCSRSTASTHSETQLHLEVDPSGAATLELHSESRSSMRSVSFSGKRGRRRTTSSQTGSLEGHQWTGRATTGAQGEMVLTFDQVTTSEVDWMGYGSLPLPAPQTQQAQLVLTCTPAPLDVYAAQTSGRVSHTAGPGETPTAVPGYECSVVSGATYMLQRLGAIPFAKDVSLARFVESGFGGEHSLLRRR